MTIGSWVLRFAVRFFSNPLRTLAVLIVLLAAINYKTLISGLPQSVPEVDTWLAGMTTLNLTLGGSLTGTSGCWRMRYTFLTEDGSPLVDGHSAIARLGTKNPETTLTLPQRHTYLLRLQTEEILADPENSCLPFGSAANLRSKSSETLVSGLKNETRLHNACDFSGDTNECRLEYR